MTLVRDGHFVFMNPIRWQDDSHRRGEAKMATVATPGPGPGKQIINFVRHFGEMCIAMCVGGIALYAAFFGAAGLIGYPDLPERSPELSVIAVAFIYAFPMAAWMRFRGMEWRPTLEMSGATIGVGILLISLAWTGVTANSDLSEWADPSFCGPACVAMLVVMMLRLDLYTGRAGHHVAHATHVA